MGRRPLQLMSNVAKGRTSYDANVGGSLIAFVNKNVTEYPTDVGGPKFDLVPVTKQKDIMLNVARLHARQEYDRIMELVAVLQKQAEGIKRRLDVTDQVHSAIYSFQLYHNRVYWLVYDANKNATILSPTAPTEWNTGIPEGYNYIAAVKWLGDHTWIEVDQEGNPVE